MTQNSFGSIELHLAPESLLDSLKGWKDACELVTPMSDEIKLLWIASKEGNLRRFIETGKAWRYVIGACQPGPAGREKFGELVDAIDEFLLWAQFSLEELIVQSKH